MSVGPRFKHDNHQPFIGRLKRYDVYYNKHSDEAILRFGSDGPEYRAIELNDVTNTDVLALVNTHLNQMSWEANQESSNR